MAEEKFYINVETVLANQTFHGTFDEVALQSALFAFVHPPPLGSDATTYLTVTGTFAGEPIGLHAAEIVASGNYMQAHWLIQQLNLLEIPPKTPA